MTPAERNRTEWQAIALLLVGSVGLYLWLGWTFLSFLGFALAFGIAGMNLFHRPSH